MTHELSYKQLKTCNDARISEEQRNEHRKRNILLLILHYLQEDGYLNTLEVLENEAGVSLKKFEICDNIDLQTIIQEYESYFYVKFNKWPKISKRVKENHVIDSRRAVSSKNYSPSKPPSLSKRSNTVHLPSIGSSSDSDASSKKRPSSDIKSKKNKPISSDLSLSPSETSVDTDISLSGTKVPGLRDSADSKKKEKKIANDERLLKPFAGYAGLSAEYRELAAVVSRDIYLENPNVYWNDIIGLSEAKRLVKESVVYPIRYPQLFTGILSPWKGLLLYGPPGTGKTLLAKAVATECNTTFFNISASTIVSKWRGDSEKLVRVLFELARFHAPSTIFLDELDSVMGQRGVSSGGSGEHEGSRRMKTELLVQMDGLSKSDDLVFLLAASNLPWELDHAMLRRLEKRILVDLPTKDARKLMIEHYLPKEINTNKNGLQLKTELDYELLAERTDGYSGSDIRLVCKEAAMKPVRKIFDVLDRPMNENDELPEFNIDPVRTIDVEATLERTKPSARNLQAKYEKWQQQYESV